MSDGLVSVNSNSPSAPAVPAANELRGSPMPAEVVVESRVLHRALRQQAFKRMSRSLPQLARLTPYVSASGIASVDLLVKGPPGPFGSFEKSSACTDSKNLEDLNLEGPKNLENLNLEGQLEDQEQSAAIVQALRAESPKKFRKKLQLNPEQKQARERKIQEPLQYRPAVTPEDVKVPSVTADSVNPDGGSLGSTGQYSTQQPERSNESVQASQKGRFALASRELDAAASGFFPTPTPSAI